MECSQSVVSPRPEADHAPRQTGRAGRGDLGRTSPKAGKAREEAYELQCHGQAARLETAHLSMEGGDYPSSLEGIVRVRIVFRSSDPETN
jgi:hypothetical protein